MSESSDQNLTEEERKKKAQQQKAERQKKVESNLKVLRDACQVLRFFIK